MLLHQLDRWKCYKCQYRKENEMPTHKCKTCSRAYSDNYKRAREHDPKYIRRKALKEESDTRLRTLYQRIKEKYFNGEYITEGNKVVFTWKRGKRFASWCSKTRKEIRIGGIYKYAFIRKTESTNILAVSNEFNDIKRRQLVDLMIHEALHLRLAHHRKNYKRKEVEMKDKVKGEDIPALYEGLVNQ